MEPEQTESVTVRYKPSYASFVEAEAGLGRLQGREVDRPSGLSAFVMRGLIGVASLFTSTVTTIDDEGVLVQGSKYGTVPWAEIGDTYETNGLICFVIARTTVPIAIEKRAMTPVQLDLVRRFAAARVTPDEPGHVATNWSFREEVGDDPDRAFEEYQRGRAEAHPPGPPAEPHE